jgi:hypothetical protein
MDIYLHTSEGTALPGILASSQANNNADRGGSGQPAECLQFTNTATINSLFGGPDFNIMLLFFSSGPDEPGEANPPPPGLTINQQYIVFRGVSAPGITEYRTDSGTVFGHANAAGAEAVGAAFFDLTQPSPIICGEQRPPVTDASGSIHLECYSSAGSIPIYFDTSGNRLVSPEYRAKPNIVAPDGGNTTFFGFDIVNDTDGVPYASDADDWPNFFGTSASAPHAAGVAALMLDAANLGLAPDEVYSMLENTAIDMGSVGPDSDSGHGFIQADLAVEAADGGSPGNRSPVANDDSAETDEDVAVAIDVVANDSDPDNDVLTITNVTEGSDGAVSYAGEIVTYTPHSDFNGTDSFEYTVSDGDLADTATVVVTVNPVNDAPTAVNDSGATDQDTAVTVDVLSNDNDPEGDPLTVASVTTPSYGGVSINVDGTVTYSPNGIFTGVDYFDYTASDGILTDTATVSITVTQSEPLSCADLYSDKRSCQNDSNCIWVGHPKNGACEEAACTVSETPSELSCADGLDNDCDGLVDSDDPDCPTEPPADCSTYDNSTDCKADGACRWNRKNEICLAK